MADFLDIFNCCDICGADHPTEQCPELGEIPSDAQIGGYLTKARLTLPSSLKVSDSRNSPVGVIATELIPEKTQLGPFEAKRTTHVFDDTGFFTLKLVAKDGTTVCLDTTDENECNWMCLVRPAPSEETRNCMAYQLGSNIYYNTTQDIYPGKELLVWYTLTYARKLGKPVLPDGISKALLGHRIEPIQNDLIEEPLVEGTTEIDDPPTQEQQSGASEVEKELRGEIKKAFYCPRCGNTFDSQSTMVQHLREHVITGSKTVPISKKRRKGRPRIHPILDDPPDPSLRRPRGRPRKVKLEMDIDMEQDFEMNTDDQGKDDIPEDDSIADDNNVEIEDYDDLIGGDDDNREPIGKRLKRDFSLDGDVDYSPVQDVRSSGKRIMPRRSGKGTNKLLMQDYVVGKIKKEASGTNEDLSVPNGLNSQENKVNDTPETDVVSVIKRKKGRPKKIQQLITGKETGSLQVEVVKKQYELEDISIVEQNKTEDTTTSLTDKQAINNLDGKSVEAPNENIQETTQGKSNEQIETKHEANVERSTIGPDENDERTVVNNTHLDKAVSQGYDLKAEDNVARLESQQTQNNTSDIDIEVISLDKATEANIEEEIKEATSFEENVNPHSHFELVIHFDEGTEIYTCSKCKEEFVQQGDAIKHAVIHNSDDTAFNCFVCNQGFQSAAELKNHTGTCKSGNKPDESDMENKEENVEKGESSTGRHACDICQQEFKTVYYLYRHMVMHTDMFTCSACCKSFSRKDSLYKHVLKCCPNDADRLKILYCELCLRVFSTASGRDKHRAKCTLVQCKKCGSRFTSKEDMDIHKCKDGKSEDPSAGKYSCGKCPKSFQSVHYLRQHTLLHKKLHACSKCGKSLPSQDELENHSVICQTIEAIKQLGHGRCERCGEVFVSAKLFREHALSHTHPYQCSHCYRRFVRVGTLSSHDCNNQSEAFTCKTCSKQFKNAAGLDRHVKEHDCLRYQCSACGNLFHTKAAARYHVCEVDVGEGERKILYTSDSREVCSVCGKSFATRSNLHKHMLLHGEKNFPCPQCDKRFHLDVYLKEHITCVHYKIFKFQCPHCGKLLKSKTGLNTHTLLFHTESAETFACPECSKVFKSKGNLKAHMYRHSPDHKFKCHICSRTFKFPDQLSRHKVEHKIVEKISCIYCEKKFCRRYELKKHLQIYHSGYVYVCGICSAKCGHRYTLVRHYKRKHPDDYHLLSQEGYLHGLLKHVNELPDYKPPDTNEPSEGLEQIPDESGLNKFLPQDAVKALQSLSLGTCTVNEYQLLKEKGLIKTDENGEVTTFTEDQTVMGSQEGDGLQQPTIIHQEQLLTSSGETINGASIMNEQIGLIQTSDGTININNIQGLPQTLDGTDGQIVILQIVETPDQMVADISQGEIIQQLHHVGTNEPISIQQEELPVGENSAEEYHDPAVSQEVQIVNFTEGMDIGGGNTVTHMDGGLLQIQDITDEQIQQMTVDGQTVGSIQIVADGVVQNEAESS